MKSLTVALFGCLLTGLVSTVSAQQTDQPLPVIDMHMHATPATANGPAPSAICPGEPPRVVPEVGKTWIEVFMYQMQNPPCENPIWRS